MALKVLVADSIAEEGLERLRAAQGVEPVVATGLSEEALIRAVADCAGLIVRSATRVTARVIEAAPRLQVIGRAGVGVDNIDVAAATRRGILVVNTPEGNTIAAAEHTIAMLLALARNIPQAHHCLMHERAWRRGDFIGVQLQGKVLGVVGLGRTGSEVAKRAAALEMRVIGYDPFVSEARWTKLGVEPVGLDELCRRADFITVHTHLTPQSRGLIGPRQFSLMRPGVRLINCARGGIIDEEALAEALRTGRVAGAALDVFEVEPPFGSPLLELPNVVATPHLGASTHEAQVSVAIDVAESVVRALRGEPVRGAVNAPALAGDGVDGLRAYAELAERLGRLFTGVIGQHERIELIYAGEVAGMDALALTTAFLRGLLEPILHGHVNYVNASLLAQERQIRVAETREPDAGDFAGSITVRSRVEGRERSLGGALTGRQTPTLVSIDGYRVHVMHRGHLLVASNVDRPGIIGRVGTILGEAGINIAFMQVGRNTSGGQAVMVLGVDSPVPADVLVQLEEVKDLKDVRLVEW
ncbi:MAG TPA: phosphoglycerate dehydrogenase [Limnochordia bacterium]